MAVPTWFWMVGGVSLVLLGVLQLKARPHVERETPLQRWLSAGALWSACCLVMGVLLVLFGAGVVHMPGETPKAKPIQRLKH